VLAKEGLLTELVSIDPTFGRPHARYYTILEESDPRPTTERDAVGVGRVLHRGHVFEAMEATARWRSLTPRHIVCEQLGARRAPDRTVGPSTAFAWTCRYQLRPRREANIASPTATQACSACAHERLARTGGRGPLAANGATGTAGAWSSSRSSDELATARVRDVDNRLTAALVELCRSIRLIRTRSIACGSISRSSTAIRYGLDPTRSIPADEEKPATAGRPAVVATLGAIHRMWRAQVSRRRAF